MLKLPPIIFLMGPTAVGKTQLAIRLVQSFPCEIISVDSAMVYRGMNIGTAKPSHQEQKVAPHRLIDIRDIAEPYSAAQFCDDANAAIQTILAAGKIPLLVGGTMLYFRAFGEGLSVLPTANEAIRREILQQANDQGWQALHEQLQQIDPEAAAKIHANDQQRIQRALEVYKITGKTRSQHFATGKQGQPFSILKLIIEPSDREVLHQRIEARFHKMLADGFINEVKQMRLRSDLCLDLPSLRSIGYRQIWLYLDGQISYDEMISKALAASRQLAKRQLTWLRRETTANHFTDVGANLFDRVATTTLTFLHENS